MPTPSSRQADTPARPAPPPHRHKASLAEQSEVAPGEYPEAQFRPPDAGRYLQARPSRSSPDGNRRRIPAHGSLPQNRDLPSPARTPEPPERPAAKAPPRRESPSE